MSYGPSDFGSVLQGVGSLANAFAIGFAAWLGTRTFATWRAQKLTERRMSEAERILTAVYEVRRALSVLRTRVVNPLELQQARRQLKEDDRLPDQEPHKERAIRTEAYRLRFLEASEARRSLDECKPMAKALFGEELETAINELDGLFSEVGLQLNLYLQPNITRPPDRQRQIEETIWEGYPSSVENAMDQVIDSKVHRVEAACLPMLRLDANQL